jgi:hypothetical protein
MVITKIYVMQFYIEFIYLAGLFSQITGVVFHVNVIPSLIKLLLFYNPENFTLFLQALASIITYFTRLVCRCSSFSFLYKSKKQKLFYNNVSQAKGCHVYSSGAVAEQ